MKNWLMFFFLFTSFFSVAQDVHQTVVPDNRLYEVYEKDYLNGLLKENPFLIKRWNFYLDNAFLVTEEVKGKKANYPSVTIADLNKINILLLEKEQNLQRDWDVPTIYKIHDTDKILIYYAGKDFTDSLKKYLREN